MICFIGQQNVFSEGEDTLKKLKGVSINAKQIERVCHYYGELIETEEKDLIDENIFRIYEHDQANKTHYAMLDGAMYLTREDSWKESKLGRIFCADDNVKVSKERSIISNSTYVSHLGSIKGFFPKFEYHLDGLKSIVIIADGAKWIWNWADDFYPDATQILDFYHAKEHLCQFAIIHFNDKKQRSKWIEKQCKTLLEGDITDVVQAIKNLPFVSKKKEKAKENLINYCVKNRKRMNYKAFISTLRS